MPINSTTAFASVQATVADTALSLVDFGFTQAEVDRASRVRVFVNTNAIRLNWTGTAPTTSSGALLDTATGVPEWQLLGDRNIRNLQLVRNSTTSAEVFIILED